VYDVVPFYTVDKRNYLQCDLKTGYFRSLLLGTLALVLLGEAS